MDILKQCEILREKGEHKKIIDLLENLSDEQDTIEVKMELAKAYLDYGMERDNPDKDSVNMALSILLSMEEELKEDPSWNYRVGLIYGSLKNELKALPYLRFTAECRPDDEGVLDLIKLCEEQINLPIFQDNFKERTQRAWEIFAEREAHLCHLIDNQKEDEAYIDELVSSFKDIFKIAIEDISFEIGYNEQKYEIIFSVDGDRLSLFKLDYFVKRAPEKLKEHWKFLTGRQCMPNMGIRIGDNDILGEDVQVLVEKTSEHTVGLTLYSEKLNDKFKGNEADLYEFLYILTDVNLGELNAMAYIDSFDVVDTPLSDGAITLDKLSEKLEELGMKKIKDPIDILRSYLSYEMTPNEDPEADWRMDIIVGNTNCTSLIEGYLENDNEPMANLYKDGVTSGFLMYSLDLLKEENGSDRIFDFRDSLIEYLEENCGEDNIYIIGGATGIYFGYVDFIAWDLENVLQNAVNFFENSEIDFAAFHTFVRETEPVVLVKR